VALAKRVAGLTRLAAYVGIPAADSRRRSSQLMEMAGRARGKKKARLEKAAAGDAANAELLYIFSKGSPLRKQPPRPVLEPAIAAEDNAKRIGALIAGSLKASLGGDKDGAAKKMKYAAMAGQNAARGWFTDPRNNWAPNAPSTVRRKGSDRPGIDTGAMRAAIVGLVKEE
jgi:hypothetical protein